MKKLLQLSLLFFAGVTLAQTPMYFNGNTAGGANSIPFNAIVTTWRHCQFFIPANSIGGVSAGNNITKIYFHAASTANITYPNFTLRLKTGSGTGLSGVANGPFETGMTTVYQQANTAVSTTNGLWFSFTLQTPFLYDPSKPLIVDIEHDQTSGTGPTINQPGSVPGGGIGRQYGDNNNNPINGTGTQLINFGIDVIPATPCNAAPPTYTMNIVNYTTCPSIPNPTLAVSQTYSLGGLTYQWMSSTSTQFGPYAPINTNTLSSMVVPTLAATTWYQLVVTCTNVANASTTLAPTEIFVNTLNTTNTVPYVEDFEGIALANRLPNCSWYVTSYGNATKTHISAGPNNLVANSGTKFAAFNNTSPGTNYYFTNQIWLDAGVTYSAGMWYQTDLTGATNWSNLSILLGTSQSSAGLVPIVSAAPAVSPVYKPLSNLFTVSTSGYYHVAVKATGNAGIAQNLSWDDLSITIPCKAGTNTPTITLSQASSTVCQGDLVSVTASGATSYTWSDGSTGSQLVDTPGASTSYVVTGLNQLTGCTATMGLNIKVNPSPYVSAIAVPVEVCKGKPVTLMAGGAASYVWSSNAFGSVVTDTPNGSTLYSVIGTGTNNCTGMATVSVTVLKLPTVGASGSTAQLCLGEALTLTGTGATSYEWISSISSDIWQGAQVVTHPGSTGTYSVTGKDNAGCMNTAAVIVTVEKCVGLSELQINDELMVYPNPHNGEFEVASNSGKIRSIVVTDIAGRKVYEQQDASSNTSIRLTHLPAGVYYVQIITDNNRYVTKTVKQ